jgi:hypothetical protein
LTQPNRPPAFPRPRQGHPDAALGLPEAARASLRACISRQRAPARGAPGADADAGAGGGAAAGAAPAGLGAQQRAAPAGAARPAGVRQLAPQELQARLLQLLAPGARGGGPRLRGGGVGAGGRAAGAKRKRTVEPGRGRGAADDGGEGPEAGAAGAQGGGGGGSGGGGAGLSEYARALRLHLARTGGTDEADARGLEEPLRGAEPGAQAAAAARGGGKAAAAAAGPPRPQPRRRR